MAVHPQAKGQCWPKSPLLAAARAGALVVPGRMGLDHVVDLGAAGVPVRLAVVAVGAWLTAARLLSD